MMIGYADAGDTAGAITPMGFKTGDIGFINSKGALVFQGVKKISLFAAGEYQRQR